MSNNKNDKHSTTKINGINEYLIPDENHTIPDKYKALVEASSFKPKLSDVFICDKYLHNLREDISDIVEDAYMCIDITEGDMYKLISLIDTYTCDQDMYNLFINSDELKHLKKSVNLVLNDDEIKNTIRVYQILKDQRERIVAMYKEGELE